MLDGRYLTRVCCSHPLPWFRRLWQVYSLRRLARGLASGRHSARQGFAATLSSLLACSCAVDGEGLLALLDGCLPVTNSMSGSVGASCGFPASWGRVVGPGGAAGSLHTRWVGMDFPRTRVHGRSRQLRVAGRLAMTCVHHLKKYGLVPRAQG